MENYFWNSSETNQEKKLFVLIIYDIVSNKRRLKFAKLMAGYGFRVQKSAFEAIISEKLYKKLITEIPKLISAKEDSVRVYKIFGYGEVNMFGVNVRITDEDLIII